MLRALPVIASIALSVYALADAIQTEPDRVRGIPKWAWIVLIVLVPWVAPITWLLIGKERTPLGPAVGTRSASAGSGQGPSDSSARGREGGWSGSSSVRRSGPMAPDDDPEFLRSLDEENRRRRREREARERAARESAARESAGSEHPSEHDSTDGTRDSDGAGGTDSTDDDPTPGGGSSGPSAP